MNSNNINKKNDNWYRTVYQNLIIRAKSRGLDKTKLDYYTEEHHILPKCMGGNNEKYNLCLLSFKEHLLAHKILCRLHPNIGGLYVAVHGMLYNIKKNSNKKISSSELSFYREFSIKHLSEINKGSLNPAFGTHISKKHREAVSRANKGRKKSIETRIKMAESQRGKKASKETKEKLSISHTGLKIHTEERKKFLSDKWKANNPRHGVDMTGENNPTSIKVIDSNGTIYQSIKICANKNNISYSKMRDWIRNKPEKGFKIYK